MKDEVRVSLDLFYSGWMIIQERILEAAFQAEVYLNVSYICLIEYGIDEQ